VTVRLLTGTAPDMTAVNAALAAEIGAPDAGPGIVGD
jgi:hypothetical protein